MAQSSYNRISLSYSPHKVSSEGETADIDGLMLSYTRGFSLTSSAPLYLEVGLLGNFMMKSSSTTWSIGSQVISSSESTLAMLRLIAPVNVTYRIPLGGKVTLAPYAGLNITANVMGKNKYTQNGVTEETNILDNSDVNIIQLGFQAGAGFNFGKFYAGAGYMGDITSMGKKTTETIGGLVISLGYTF